MDEPDDAMLERSMDGAVGALGLQFAGDWRARNFAHALDALRNEAPFTDLQPRW